MSKWRKIEVLGFIGLSRNKRTLTQNADNDQEKLFLRKKDAPNRDRYVGHGEERY